MGTMKTQNLRHEVILKSTLCRGDHNEKYINIVAVWCVIITFWL